MLVIDPKATSHIPPQESHLFFPADHDAVHRSEKGEFKYRLVFEANIPYEDKEIKEIKAFLPVFLKMDSSICNSP